MRIRAAEERDAAAVADLWNEMIRDTLATFTPVEKSTAEIAEMIAARQGAFWVAEAGALAGFVTFGPFRSGPGYAATVEHTVVLSRAARGRGLGRDLMHCAMEAGRQQGRRVMVAAISSANPGAVAFHDALGFVQTGRMPQVGFKQGQWLDLILMQKQLNAS